MTRIAIVGISGSGKSTLANKLSKKLGIPAIHLDKYFWDIGWKERYSREDFKKVADEFSMKDEWIIDGNYRSSIDNRFERADIIIFLDYPKWRSILRVFKRIFKRGQPFDKTDGVRERVSWFLIKFILRYPIDEMRERVDKYKNNKKIYIAKNDKGIETILMMIE